MDPEQKLAAKYFKLSRKQERTKEEGNEFFKRGNNQQAIEKYILMCAISHPFQMFLVYARYTAAIAIDPLNRSFNAALFCNRAAAYIKQKNWLQASQDCSG